MACIHLDQDTYSLWKKTKHDNTLYLKLFEEVSEKEDYRKLSYMNKQQYNVRFIYRMCKELVSLFSDTNLNRLGRVYPIRPQ